MKPQREHSILCGFEHQDILQRAQAEGDQSREYDLQHAPAQCGKIYPAGSGRAGNQLPGDVGDAKAHQIGGQNGQQAQWIMAWQYE